MTNQDHKGLYADWLTCFRDTYYRATGMVLPAYIRPSVFYRCGYTPELAVYELTGKGATHA